MKKVKITAIRKIQYDDLMARYENPIEHTCDVCEGQSWISTDGQCPQGLCPEAWKTMKEFVEALARGEGNFFDGWMKNPYSAMISCNDGFRPVSFYIETIEEKIMENNTNTSFETKVLDPLTEMLEYNKRFVAEKQYEQYQTSKYPDKKLAIVTCMDTRLVKLLPAALGIKNGDVKIIKNAGGTITNPFDSTVRSLLVAIYELGVNEIMIIGHTTCGVQGMDGKEMLDLMRDRGIDEEHISLMKHCGIDLESWLHGFDETDAAIMETVDLVKNHPLIPKDVIVKGYIMDSVTGELTLIE